MGQNVHSASLISTQNILQSVRWRTLHVKDLVHGLCAVISITPQWISGLNSRSTRKIP